MNLAFSTANPVLAEASLMRSLLQSCFPSGFSRVYEWLSANKLTLTMTKTEFMLIASKQKLSQFTESPSLTINENAIEQVTSAKSLGVYVDQNINWECHIENISKIACAIGAIKRIRHLTPFNILIKVYNSLIQPQFDYCKVVWGSCNKGLSEKLQRLQNRTAHTLMSASYDSNLDDLFRTLPRVAKTLLSKIGTEVYPNV